MHIVAGAATAALLRMYLQEVVHAPHPRVEVMRTIWITTYNCSFRRSHWQADYLSGIVALLKQSSGLFIKIT